MLLIAAAAMRAVQLLSKDSHAWQILHLTHKPSQSIQVYTLALLNPAPAN